MSNKTKRHYKKHHISKTKTRRHYKKRRTYKRRNVARGIPSFVKPDFYKPTKIIVNRKTIQAGNLIKGLRNM